MATSAKRHASHKLDNKAAHMAKLRTRGVKKLYCECGKCGERGRGEELSINPKPSQQSRFKPGHDAKAKAVFTAASKGKINIASLGRRWVARAKTWGFVQKNPEFMKILAMHPDYDVA